MKRFSTKDSENRAENKRRDVFCVFLMTWKQKRLKIWWQILVFFMLFLLLCLTALICEVFFSRTSSIEKKDETNRYTKMNTQQPSIVQFSVLCNCLWRPLILKLCVHINGVQVVSLCQTIERVWMAGEVVIAWNTKQPQHKNKRNVS